MSAVENSKKIIEYYDKKYGSPVGYAGLIKAICCGSIKIKNVFPLSLLCVSTSQSFKSRTSEETSLLFPKYFENFGSDFTIHSLMEKYHDGKDMSNKIGGINDMVVLFTSKSSRGKDRLLGAFAESLSEGRYTYSDFSGEIEWSPGRYGLVANMTFEKYELMQQELVESTFDERLLKFYYKVPLDTWNKFNEQKDLRILMKPPKLVYNMSIKSGEMKSEENIRINQYAEELRINSLSQSKGKCFDKIQSILYGNAALNNRNYLVEEDYKILDNILPFTTNPLSNKSKILRMFVKGHTVNEILKEMKYSKNSADLIYRWKKQFILRGLLEQKEHEGDVDG